MLLNRLLFVSQISNKKLLIFAENTVTELKAEKSRNQGITRVKEKIRWGE
jgi:hypothetical protein